MLLVQPRLCPPAVVCHTQRSAPCCGMFLALPPAKLSTTPCANPLLGNPLIFEAPLVCLNCFLSLCFLTGLCIVSPALCSSPPSWLRSCTLPRKKVPAHPTPVIFCPRTLVGNKLPWKPYRRHLPHPCLCLGLIRPQCHKASPQLSCISDFYFWELPLLARVSGASGLNLAPCQAPHHRTENPGTRNKSQLDKPEFRNVSVTFSSENYKYTIFSEEHKLQTCMKRFSSLMDKKKCYQQWYLSCPQGPLYHLGDKILCHLIYM